MLGVHVHTDPGTGEHLGDEVEYCGDCIRGWVIPEHVIEAVASVFRDAGHSEPFATQYAELALVAGLEAARDKETT